MTEDWKYLVVAKLDDQSLSTDALLTKIARSFTTIGNKDTHKHTHTHTDTRAHRHTRTTTM